MIKLAEIKVLHNFEPKYNFLQFQEDLPQRVGSQIVRDGKLYEAVKALTEKAYPSEESKYEKRWCDFYVPLKRRDYFILFPLTIILYNKRFFLSFSQSQIEVCNGKERNEFYLDLIQQTMEFSGILKNDPSIIAQWLPYDIRTGRVPGQYVLEKLLPAENKEQILRLYKRHIEKEEGLHGISLDNYLNTAAICYRAAFGNKTKGLTAEEMYRKWADSRDCGMLKIKNKKSKEDFGRWLDNESHCGGHPFEIIFSWLEDGIHLYPPYKDNPYFTLSVTNYMYSMSFLEMVKALIRNNISFKAHDLEGVLDYLSGECYFTVNAFDKHYISYSPADKKLLKHIEWDEPEILKWK